MQGKALLDFKKAFLTTTSLEMHFDEIMFVGEK